MHSLIVVHPDFDRIWPLAADHLYTLWNEQGDVEFIRLEHDDRRPLGQIVIDPSKATRMIVLGVPITLACLKRFPLLREVVSEGIRTHSTKPEYRELLESQGITVYSHPSEEFWGQSVAEVALALTISGLRRIPQLHHQILSEQTPWNYSPPDNKGQAGYRGAQYADDPRFVNGTVAGKRVRIVGVGNIGSRYASFVHMLGAEVAAWDPYASEPCFHRAGARREQHLDRLLQDADIFAPMVPLNSATRKIISQKHIQMLPQGCLVVLVTRALICDTQALRARVLADEISLAADVFDVEPLPFDDPLLGRHNVIHTPHIAGRTRHANERWAEMLVSQFQPC